MKNYRYKANDLCCGKLELPKGGTVDKRVVIDPNGSPMTVVMIHNGHFSFTVLPDRGMDVGEIRLGNEKMSWDRSGDYLMHPDHVNLQEGNGTGWLKGFYGAITSIGPELFGTPGEGYTLHGTGSYSQADLDSVFIECDEQGIQVEGMIKVQGYGDIPLFEKHVRMVCLWGSSSILREETTWNVSAVDQTVDDGYHIQLCGPYLHQGGRYVLPVDSRDMLLRDSAPAEEDPLRIPPRDQGKTPIRCYQYVPGRVDGLADVVGIDAYVDLLDQSEGITAEMVLNEDSSVGGFVVRPLSCFPRSLIAKEISDSFMFAIEPCRTRPNRMSQKHTDGEAFLLKPGESATTQCLVGVTRDRTALKTLETAIEQAAER
jgi:hypothetical protein